MGGLDNHIQSPGLCNTIAGGFQNFVAAEQAACLSSGDSFESCSIFGGWGNRVRGVSPITKGATVGGGLLREATGDYDWQAGGLFQDQ